MEKDESDNLLKLIVRRKITSILIKMERAFRSKKRNICDT